MKTLCLTLVLLLLGVCSINALPAALQVAPHNCCFKFNAGGIRRDRVSDVTKTHSQCRKRAFIVETVKGNLLCYSQSSRWAKTLYKELHGTEGSGLNA